MALPPTIPTSFVPQQGSASSRSRLDFSGTLLFLSGLVLFVALLGSAFVFFYGRYLAGEVKTKDAAVATAEAGVDQGTIASLITLQAQLAQGKTLLDNHIALSQSFDALQSLTPASVSYSSLSIMVNSDDTATLSLSGSAASFNALAALSADLATDLDIKDAIFSGINVGKSGVGFAVSAVLDPALVEIPADGLAATTPASSIAPAATSTP